MSRRLLLALLLAVATMTLGFWLKCRILPAPDRDTWEIEATKEFAFTDIVGIYYERDVGSHPLPYAEMKVEYPPVVGAMMYLTSFAPGPQGYLAANYAVLALAALATVWAIHLLNREAPLWIFAATPPLVLYAGLNWDLIAIFFAMASLVLFQRGRDLSCAVALALGTWSKIFPALLLPVFLCQRAREGNGRAIKTMVITFGLLSLAINLPVFLLAPWGWGELYIFSVGRGADGGSLWHNFPGFPMILIDALGLAAVFAGLALLSRTGLRNLRPPAEIGLTVLIIFIMANKVSSPQYHLWLMPFLALFPPPLWLLSLFLAVDLAYYALCFQSLFVFWGGQSALADALIAMSQPISLARLTVLFLLLVFTARKLLRPASRDEPTLLRGRLHGRDTRDLAAAGYADRRYTV